MPWLDSLESPMSEASSASLVACQAAHLTVPCVLLTYCAFGDTAPLNMAVNLTIARRVIM